MSTQVQTEERKPHPLVVMKEQIEQRESEFARALPAHIPVERFKRVVLTAVQNNPDLLAADRQSFFNSCMRSAQDGLLPDGRDGAIVIYNTKEKRDGRDVWVKKAQWMPMVFGILKKIRNSGELAAITARVVYAGDKFRYWVDDSGEHVEYEPADNPDTNVIRRVFAMAKTKDGELYVEPMTVDQIEKVRAVSRAKDTGPWKDWWDQMAIKTVLRRLAKRLPMSSDLDDLIRRDDDLYDLRGAGDAEVKGPRPSLAAALDRLAAPSSRQEPQMIEAAASEPASNAQDDESGVGDETGDSREAEETRPQSRPTDGQGSFSDEKSSSSASAAASEFPGDQPAPSAAPDFAAMIERFKVNAPQAETIEELENAADELLPHMDGEALSRNQRELVQGIWEDNRKRIVERAQASKASGKKTGQVDASDPDYRKGWADAERGATKCLKQEIRDSEERLAKWKAGFDAFHAQGAEG